MTTTAPRAKRGGEIGKNGEFYPGGTFLPNTTLRKRNQKSSRGTGKQEIAPYVWEVAPKGKTSLYRQFAGVFGSVVNGVAVMRTDDRLESTLNYFGTTLEQAKSIIERWNAGERWS